MATALGNTALEALKGFRSRNWFPVDFRKFAERVAKEYGERNEVTKGCLVESGSGTDSATELYLQCDAIASGNVILNGKLYGIADTANVDMANAGGDVASLVVTYGNPSGGADPAMATAGTTNPVPEIHITSGGVTFKARIYDNAQTQSYDTAGSFDVQIDAGVRTLTEQADDLKAAIEAKFSGYTVAKAANSDAFNLTITAASPGSGFNFTYAEKYNDGADAISNVAGSATDVTVDVGGIIFTDGSSAAGIDSTNTAKVAIIATDSDLDGGALAEGSDVYLLAVVSGTSSSALGSAFPTSEEIQSALAASSSNVTGYNHSGATGWVHLAQVTWTTSSATILLNRNNHLGA